MYRPTTHTRRHEYQTAINERIDATVRRIKQRQSPRRKLYSSNNKRVKIGSIVNMQSPRILGGEVIALNNKWGFVTVKAPEGWQKSGVVCSRLYVIT